MSKKNIARAVQAARMVLHAGKELVRLTKESMVPIIGEKERWDRLMAARPIIGAVSHHFNYALEWLESTIDLCEKRQNSAAEILLRSLFETARRGAWIAHPQGNAEKRAQSFSEYYNALAHAVIIIHAPVAGVNHSLGKLKEDREIRAKNKNKFQGDSYCHSVHKVLDDLGEKKRYEAYYRTLSISVHGLPQGDKSSPMVSWNLVLEAANSFVVIARATAEVCEIPKDEFDRVFQPAIKAVKNEYLREAKAQGIKCWEDSKGNLVMETPRRK